ncbi:MAG: ATP-grasp domain-containing protein [Thermomicrobiales bacterium]|nr:ATP-grasp domain-containing protein [Thermomicrobiales bacterium]
MSAPPEATAPRVLLLYTPTSYRATAFIAAAERLGLDVVHGMDTPEPLASHWGLPVALDFARPEEAIARIGALHAEHPFAAVLAVDDGATLLAVEVSAALGLPHNDPASALAARDKWEMRQRLAAAKVPVPAFRRYPLDADPAAIADDQHYPCVVKPLRLSGSRGVIRADDADAFVAAWERTRRIIESEGANGEPALLVESYLPGVEVAVEGLLTGGKLRLLAIFDKPDPLEGPFFEETIYVTPSRLPPGMQAEIAARTAQAAAAVGLREGPVHAELRINAAGVWPIELAGRSIGGLCSSVLEFGVGIGLEELILRHAVGWPLPATAREHHGAGVMMIPIPRGGMLRGVEGVAEACAEPGVTGVEITARVNHPVTPLPEGSSYLGFIFARTDSPAAAEAALRAAHARLRFRIEPTIGLTLIP